MKITYLGQAGFLFETGGRRIIVDPYLSNSVAEIQPSNFRRFGVDERFLKLRPDFLVITHNHADHFDKETLKHYLNENSAVTVLSPCSVWQDIRQFGGTKNNYVLFNNGTVWTEKDIKFYAVKAEHSDSHAIGVIINAENKNYYITGDTLYNETIFDNLPCSNFDAVFLPINGKGNNMNYFDAANFAKRIGAKNIIPMHFGLFDELTAENFVVDNKIIPIPYQEIKI